MLIDGHHSNRRARHGQTAAPLYTDSAYAGLKLALGYDLTVALVYRQTDTITAGLVLCQLPDGTGALPSVAVAAASAATIVPFGVMVKDATLDHAPDPLFMPTAAPLLPVVLSIMQRGSTWTQVTAGQICTAESAVHFGGDGTVSDAGTYLLQHGLFLAAPMTLQDGSRIVPVQLHAPLAA